jgi:hypothetical protein
MHAEGRQKFMAGSGMRGYEWRCMCREDGARGARWEAADGHLGGSASIKVIFGPCMS